MCILDIYSTTSRCTLKHCNLYIQNVLQSNPFVFVSNEAYWNSILSIVSIFSISSRLIYGRIYVFHCFIIDMISWCMQCSFTHAFVESSLKTVTDWIDLLFDEWLQFAMADHFGILICHSFFYWWPLVRLATSYL